MKKHFFSENWERLESFSLYRINVYVVKFLNESNIIVQYCNTSTFFRTMSFFKEEKEDQILALAHGI